MIEQIKELITPMIVSNNYVLDDVNYVKEGNIWFLRVTIDKEGYINIDDCATVSNLINPILDKVNLIKESYILDVCSKEKGGSNE